MRKSLTCVLFVLSILALAACDMSKSPVGSDPDPDPNPDPGPVEVTYELVTAFGPYTEARPDGARTGLGLTLSLNASAAATADRELEVVILGAEGEAVTGPASVTLAEGSDHTTLYLSLPQVVYQPGKHAIAVLLGGEEVARDEHDLSGYATGLAVPTVSAAIDAQHITVTLGDLEAHHVFASFSHGPGGGLYFEGEPLGSNTLRFEYDPAAVTRTGDSIVGVAAMEHHFDGSRSVTTRFLDMRAAVTLEEVISAYITQLTARVEAEGGPATMSGSLIGTVSFPLGAPAPDSLAEGISMTFKGEESSLQVRGVDPWVEGDRTVHGIAAAAIEPGSQAYVSVSVDGVEYNSEPLYVESEVIPLETPVITVAEYTGDEVRLAWSEVEGANIYMVGLHTADWLHSVELTTQETSVTFTTDSGVPLGGSLVYELLALTADPYAPANQIVPASLYYAELHPPAE